MSRRTRTLAACFASLALVFAQVAASAHLCVQHQKGAPAEVMAHHEGCGGAMEEEQAPANGNVCEQHCQYGSASVDHATPAPAAVDSAGPWLRVETGTSASSADARPAWRFVPAAAPPPPAILFGVLRI